jgi:hypothetical protein
LGYTVPRWASWWSCKNSDNHVIDGFVLGWFVKSDVERPDGKSKICLHGVPRMGLILIAIYQADEELDNQWRL